MANITYGNHIQLSQFATVVDFLMAICYRERGAEYLDVHNINSFLYMFYVIMIYLQTIYIYINRNLRKR